MTEPQQPQWTPPPQQPAGWGPGGVAPVERPMGVTLAAIFLIVIGALVTLAGACVAFAGGLLGGAGAQDPSGVFGAIMGMALVGGLIIGVWGVLHIVAGAGILGGKNWARWTGIVLAVIGLIFGVLGLVGTLGAGGGADIASGLVVQLVFVVLYALTAWALFQANAYFAYRR